MKPNSLVALFSIALIILFNISSCSAQNKSWVDDGEYCVQEIIPLIDLGLNQTELKEEFKCCYSLILAIKSGTILPKNACLCDNMVLNKQIELGSPIVKSVFVDTTFTSEPCSFCDLQSDSLISSKFIYALKDNLQKDKILCYQTNIGIDWGKQGKLIIYVFDRNKIGFYFGSYIIVFKMR